MADRQLVYPGAIPLETDILNSERNMMTAIAALASALFGSTTTANNLAVGPTSPATMSVQVGAGEIYAVANLDSTAFSSLPADTAHQIVKQGINLDAVTLACPAPTGAGTSINYLIEAALVETDSGSTVLPYYNASDPTTAWSGPVNSGAAQPTKRAVSVSVIAKPGTAATTGSQATPATDAGYIPLAVVTVAYGQTTITSSSISVPANAPVVPAGGILAALKAIAYASRAEVVAGTSTSKGVTPDGLAQAVLAGAYTYATAAGTANALTVTLAPAPSAVAEGMRLRLKAASANTGAATLAVNGGSAIQIYSQGAALKAGMIQAGQIYEVAHDGTRWQLRNASLDANAAVQGHLQLPNGMVLNWGVGSNTDGSGALAVTFDRAYASGVFVTIATNRGSSVPTAFHSCGNITTTGMTVYSATASGVAAGSGTAFCWFTLGI